LEKFTNPLNNIIVNVNKLKWSAHKFNFILCLIWQTITNSLTWYAVCLF
jgi:hypothetical protein